MRYILFLSFPLVPEVKDIGEALRLQPIAPRQREWRPATVTRQLGLLNRTYEVTTPEGRQLRRNRQLIRPTKASQNLEVDSEADWHNLSGPPDEKGNRGHSSEVQRQLKTPVIFTPTIPPMQKPAPEPAPDPDHPLTVPTVEYLRTRSGRISKPPIKLDL